MSRNVLYFYRGWNINFGFFTEEEDDSSEKVADFSKCLTIYDSSYAVYLVIIN